MVQNKNNKDPFSKTCVMLVHVLCQVYLSLFDTEVLSKIFKKLGLLLEKF